jgi:hypothetical protein
MIQRESDLYVAIIDIAEGGIQKFRGADLESLCEQLIHAQENATRLIRRMDAELKALRARRTLIIRRKIAAGIPPAHKQEPLT